MKSLIYLILVITLSGCAGLQAANSPTPAPEPTYQAPAVAVPDSVAKVQSPYRMVVTFDEMGREQYQLMVPAYQMEIVFTLSNQFLTT